MLGTASVVGMTMAQERARSALARNVGPAIVWSGTDDADRWVAWTDTTPGLDLQVTVGGGVATPLDEIAPRRMREAMEEDAPRVLRVVREMIGAADWLA